MPCSESSSVHDIQKLAYLSSYIHANMNSNLHPRKIPRSPSIPRPSLRRGRTLWTRGHLLPTLPRVSASSTQSEHPLHRINPLLELPTTTQHSLSIRNRRRSSI